MVNTDKLNRAIKAAGLRKDGIAVSLGISRQALSNKINNRTEFRTSEAKWLKDSLNLSADLFVDIFFAKQYDSQSHIREAE